MAVVRCALLSLRAHLLHFERDAGRELRLRHGQHARRGVQFAQRGVAGALCVAELGAERVQQRHGRADDAGLVVGEHARGLEQLL